MILAAAKQRFAESGYERATIRAIAADANIDPSRVMRYFGNKDLLFAAAADFDLQIPDLSDGDRDNLGARLVAHFLDRWERDEALVVLLRSSTTNDEAAQRMRKIFSSQLRPVIARINTPMRRAAPGWSPRRFSGRRCAATCYGYHRWWRCHTKRWRRGWGRQFSVTCKPCDRLSNPSYDRVDDADDRDVPGGCVVVVNAVGGYGFLSGVSVPSSTVPLVLIAITTLAACVTLGGGLYEILVVDPLGPSGPASSSPATAASPARGSGYPPTRSWRCC